MTAEQEARAQAVLTDLKKRKLQGELDFAGNPEILERVRLFEKESFAYNRPATIAAAKTEDIERLALLDNLTDLYNYRTFVKELKAEISRSTRYQQPVALILLVVDNIDTVNQQFGHLTCDSVMRIVGNVLKNSVREQDIPVKYDEQTFGAILPQTHAAVASFVAERIRTRIGNQAISHNWHNFSVTASLGVAAFPAHANSHDKLIARATEALQFANLRGGDRVFSV
ncbi:MAG TPA: GGDEF domain-containing protein [Oculatellaceae cyanobacterium]